MLKQLLYKLFGLEDPPCISCEVLHHELEMMRAERNLLLNKLIEPKSETTSVNQVIDPVRPVPTSSFMPWRVRKQILEDESRQKARILSKFEVENKEITTGDKTAELEKELGVIEDATRPI